MAVFGGGAAPKSSISCATISVSELYPPWTAILAPRIVTRVNKRGGGSFTMHVSIVDSMLIKYWLVRKIHAWFRDFTKSAIQQFPALDVLILTWWARIKLNQESKSPLHWFWKLTLSLIFFVDFLILKSLIGFTWIQNPIVFPTPIKLFEDFWFLTLTRYVIALVD